MASRSDCRHCVESSKGLHLLHGEHAAQAVTIQQALQRHLTPVQPLQPAVRP